jgi:hypothetical protein
MKFLNEHIDANAVTYSAAGLCGVSRHKSQIKVAS